MNFTDIEQKRKTRGVISSIAGIDNKSDDQTKMQEKLDNRNLTQEEQPVKKGRPKENRETKKRISLAIYPSIYDDIGKIAYVDRESISEVIGRCLENYIKQNQDKIKEYDRIKK